MQVDPPFNKHLVELTHMLLVMVYQISLGSLLLSLLVIVIPFVFYIYCAILLWISVKLYR